jgi:hypothetical protein
MTEIPSSMRFVKEKYSKQQLPPLNTFLPMQSVIIKRKGVRISPTTIIYKFDKSLDENENDYNNNTENKEVKEEKKTIQKKLITIKTIDEYFNFLPTLFSEKECDPFDKIVCYGSNKNYNYRNEFDLMYSIEIDDLIDETFENIFSAKIRVCEYLLCLLQHFERIPHEPNDYEESLKEWLDSTAFTQFALSKQNTVFESLKTKLCLKEGKCSDSKCGKPFSEKIKEVLKNIGIIEEVPLFNFNGSITILEKYIANTTTDDYIENQFAKLLVENTNVSTKHLKSIIFATRNGTCLCCLQS